MTERTQNADFRRKPQIFSQIRPFSWKFQHLEGAGNRRKPQIFAGNRRFSQKTAGNRRLGSVTLGLSPLARPYKFWVEFCCGFLGDFFLLFSPRKKARINPSTRKSLAKFTWEFGSPRISAEALSWKIITGSLVTLENLFPQKLPLPLPVWNSDEFI